ncbi:hypothetical protein V2W45_1342817 [Cenococcum geophilum]
MSLAVLGLSLPTTAPLTLLRIAPLLSSTGSLVHALVELITTSAFLGRSIPPQPSPRLSHPSSHSSSIAALAPSSCSMPSAHGAPSRTCISGRRT